jgi:hypothetical protein
MYFSKKLISYRLECPRCHRLMLDPVKAMPCKHYQCRQCFDQLKKKCCVTDLAGQQCGLKAQEEFWVEEPDEFLRLLISDFQRRCPCGWKGYVHASHICRFTRESFGVQKANITTFVSPPPSSPPNELTELYDTTEDSLSSIDD